MITIQNAIVGKVYYGVGMNRNGKYIASKVILESVNEPDKYGDDCDIIQNGCRIGHKLSKLYETRKEAKVIADSKN